MRGSTTCVAVVALVTMVGSGCSRDDDPLAGTQWRLTEWTLSSLSPAGFTITAAFADGRISGRSAVNSYSGSYEVGPGSAFGVGQLSSTRMAGPEPAMRAEGAYMTLLAQARSYEVREDRLTLFDAGGNESLVFAAASR
jgi:heat shock protein HslJ